MSSTLSEPTRQYARQPCEPFGRFAVVPYISGEYRTRNPILSTITKFEKSPTTSRLLTSVVVVDPSGASSDSAIPFPSSRSMPSAVKSTVNAW